MEEVAAAARRIERMEKVILSMQDQIRILTKDLAKANDPLTSQATAATTTAALAPRQPPRWLLPNHRRTPRLQPVCLLSLRQPLRCHH